MPRRTLKYLASKPSYVTLTELARALDLPFKKADRLLHSGVFEPDAILGRSGLFLQSRLPDLARAIATGNLEKHSCGPRDASEVARSTSVESAYHNRRVGPQVLSKL